MDLIVVQPFAGYARGERLTGDKAAQALANGQGNLCVKVEAPASQQASTVKAPPARR